MAAAPVIGITGCLPTMPDSFPIDTPENAGNMIHARAPMEMFPHAVYARTSTPPWGAAGSFRTWVNREATHVIITVANFLKVNLPGDDGAKYQGFQNMLESFDAEIVIFGFGAQAPTMSLEDAIMAPEAIELMRYLGQRCRVVGVRGEFTRRVFRHFANVENTFVTGCPSLFSRPHAIKQMWHNSVAAKRGLFAYSGTVLHKPEENKMLLDSLQRRQFLIEPVNRHNHRFFLEALIDPKNADVPYFVSRHLASGRLTAEEANRYYSTFYRLFRDTTSWYRFNEDLVSFTYGTRFHVNMASLLSGVPALWVTHDSRTQELADFLHLPHIPIDEAWHLTPEELRLKYDPLAFFDNIRGLFDHFSDYLEIFDLPRLRLDF